MKRRVIAMAIAGAFLVVGAAGCAKSDGEARAADTQSAVNFVGGAASEPTNLISSIGSTVTQEQIVIPPTSEMQPSADPDAVTEETATTEPTSAPSTDLEQLQFGDEFMEPGSLDGIDVMNDKVVALTFDDGPHPSNTPKLLDILKENDVPATFFMVGENAKEYPDIVKRAYEEGNEIGTHSWDHSSNFKKWSHDEVMDQISRANDAIQDATGLRAIIDRPPEGAITQEIAEGIGRAQILWDCDPNDWKPENRDPDIVYDNVINGGEIHDGSIVLSHDIRETTIDAYDRIIKELKSQGYKFVTVTQLMQIADARGKDVNYVFNGAPSASSAAESQGSGDSGGSGEGSGDSGESSESSGDSGSSEED